LLLLALPASSAENYVTVLTMPVQRLLDINIPSSIPAGAELIKLNIVKKEEVYGVFEKIFSKFGKIDILVNNAGVNTFDPFEERKEEDFDFVMDVNLKGTFFCIQAFLNLYKKYGCKKGSIINIGSFYGVISPDFRIYTDCLRRNSEVYGATKAGIIQMTKYFAANIADQGIRVNCVSPGGIFNPENPQGDDFIKNYSFRCPMNRMANTEEMVGAIMYFASDAASYTTGQNLVVDGGMTIW
jgi:NAD(P)-dependent dehydrogenase (short-subunit alcohol dehydrogenase family)